MRLRPDDDIYRARLLYLGPTGYTLPWHLPYAEWGLFAVLAATLTTTFLLLTGDLRWIGLTVGAAMVLTSYIWRHVDADRPARTVIKTFLTDRRAIRPDPEQLPRLSARHIKFRDQIMEGQQ
jgi:hypothetical protein